MNELEKIQHTKSFIDKLANGINPLDDKPVADSDIINNVSISRCLFYASDIMRRIIENGGIKPIKNALKVPFSISQEQLSSFPYSEDALCISEITRIINSFIDTDTMRSLSYSDITKWLLQIDALCEEPNPQGKMVKRPTETGRQLGLSLERRTGMYGEYFVVLYNKNAQAFIIDNFDAILSLKNQN